MAKKIKYLRDLDVGVVGKKVLNARLLLCITKEELADAVGISIEQVEKYEKTS